MLQSSFVLSFSDVIYLWLFQLFAPGHILFFTSSISYFLSIYPPFNLNVFYLQNNQMDYIPRVIMYILG